MQLDFEQFSFLRERMYELSKLEKKRNELLSQINKQEQLIVKLEVELEMEEKDVEELMKLSLKNLFYTILRSKDEQLEEERRQALEAALRLQEAKTCLHEYKIELNDFHYKIASLSNVHDEYAELMRQKEARLRNMPATAMELEEIERKISNQSLFLKELKEALGEGEGVLSLLELASKSLEKAENWGNWDMWMNGGIISTHIKHEHIDEARDYIHIANRQLQSFNKELSDIQRSILIEIDISSMLTMADYWFDGLIVDWIVQGKIENAQNETESTIRQLEPVIAQLEKEVHHAEQQLEGLKYERVQWIENTKLY